MALECYDATFCPAPFGLNNTSVICHFNSLMQAMASCSSVVRAALTNVDELSKTGTGTAFCAFMAMVATDKGAKTAPDSEIRRQSGLVLNALVKDLQERKPKVRYGA